MVRCVNIGYPNTQKGCLFLLLPRSTSVHIFLKSILDGDCNANMNMQNVETTLVLSLIFPP